MFYNRNELVKVHLNVYKPIRGFPGRYTDYFVAVVGPGVQLGNEDPYIAPRCSPAGRHFWTKLLWLPKETDVYIKFLLVRASTNAIVDVEEIIPHRLYIGRKPLHVEMVYNKTTMLVEQADDAFKAVDKGKHRVFHIPSLSIQRSERVRYKVQNVESQPEFTDSTKIQTEPVASVMDNSIDPNSSEQQKHGQNENCTKTEILRMGEIKPRAQYEMTRQTDGMIMKEELSSPSIQLTTTCPKQAAIPNEKMLTNPLTQPTNITVVKAAQKDQVSNPLTHSSDRLIVEPIQKEQKFTKPHSQPTDSTAVDAIKKEKNLANPQTQSAGTTAVDAIQKEQNQTNSQTQSADSTAVDASQKEQNLTNPLTQPAGSTTLDAIQKEQKLTNPQTQSSGNTTVDTIQKEQNLTNPLTQPAGSTAVDAIMKEKNLTHSQTQPADSTTVDTIQKKQKLTNPITKPTNSTAVDTIQKEQKLINPMTKPAGSTTVDTIQKEQKLINPMTKRINSTAVDKNVDIMIKSNMASSKNAGLDMSAVKTATVKPLQQQNVSSTSIDSPRNPGISYIADETNRKATKNFNDEEEFCEVKSHESGHFPIKKKGLMLVAAGVAFASYLGYRAFR